MGRARSKQGRAANEFSVCGGCGITYKDFRLPPDINFSSVQSEFWSDSNDYKDWYFKTRHTFLGRLHEYKLRHWAEHVEQCEEYARTGKVPKYIMREDEVPDAPETPYYEQGKVFDFWASLPEREIDGDY